MRSHLGSNKFCTFFVNVHLLKIKSWESKILASVSVLATVLVLAHEQWQYPTAQRKQETGTRHAQWKFINFKMSRKVNYL